MILFTDDDADILILYQMMMRRLKMPALYTPDGVEALTICRSQPICLVVSDVNKRGMNGLALLDALRADPITCHIPLMFVSATDDYHYRHEMGYSQAADDFLAKPFEPAVLQQKINALLTPACPLG